jgi:hypothetical protein
VRSLAFAECQQITEARVAANQLTHHDADHGQRGADAQAGMVADESDE